MYDLIVVALQTDTTRVITYRQPVGTLLGSLGLKIAAHDMTHYTTGERLEASQRRDVAQSELLAGLLDKLKATKEPDGSFATRPYGAGLRQQHSHGPLPRQLPDDFRRAGRGPQAWPAPRVAAEHAAVQCLADSLARPRHRSGTSWRQHWRGEGAAGMRVSLLIALVFLCLVAGTGCGAGAGTSRRNAASVLQRLLLRSATAPRNKKASCDWMTISFVIKSVEEADRWQKILNQLNSGEMPPEDAKQPDRGRKTEFLDALSQTLCDGAEDHRRPGRPHHSATTQSTRIPEYHPRSARRRDRRARFADRRRHRHVRYGRCVAVHVERSDRAVPCAWSSCAGRPFCPRLGRPAATVQGTHGSRGCRQQDE